MIHVQTINAHVIYYHTQTRVCTSELKEKKARKSCCTYEFIGAWDVIVESSQERAYPGFPFRLGNIRDISCREIIFLLAYF